METWVEKHPYKMAGIVSLIVVMYAIIFHGFNVLPHQWDKLFLWCPVIIAPNYLVAFLSKLSEKNK